MLKDNYNIFVYDCETSGFSDNAEILAFAGVLLDSDLEPIASINEILRPSSPNILETNEAKDAFEVHGIDNQTLINAPTKHDFLKKFWALRKQHRKDWVPCGYNLPFDTSKFKYLLWQTRKLKPNWRYSEFFHHYNLDLQGLFLYKNWLSNKTKYCRLKDACKAYGIVNKKEHDAMSDVQATAELLRIFMKESQNV